MSETTPLQTSISTPASPAETPELGVPPAPVPPAPAGPNTSAWEQLKGLAIYLTQSQVHTYAFSVAANAILSLFPFLVLMYTIAQKLFHSHAMEGVLKELVRFFLPLGQDFVARNLPVVAARQDLQIISVIMLFISCTGIFLPLEVALNQVWGVTKDRNFLMNQVVSLGLAVLMAVLALGSVILNTSQRALLRFVFFGHTHNAIYETLVSSLLGISTVIASILFFFFIYWILPNRKLPARAVIPTAVTIGLLWEVAKLIYIKTLPLLDFASLYGPFTYSVGLIFWAYISGLLMLAGAHYSATRYTLRLAHQADLEAEEQNAKGA